MKVYSKSDIGLVRENNQDYYDVKWFSDESLAAIVCDGMGGANGGSTASHNTVDFISDKLKTLVPETMAEEEVKTLMLDITQDVNLKIFQKAQSDSDLLGMGTTIVFVIIVKNTVHLVHAGDSRAYIISKRSIKQVTRDHSIVQELLESGEITKEQAQHHPRKNVITRALGVYKNLNLDYSQCELKENDFLLICTDGLTNYLNDDELLNVVSNFGEENAVDEFISEAKNRGGSDNITVVLIRK